VALHTISLFAGGAGLDLGFKLACPAARTVCYVEVGIQNAEVLAARIEEGTLDEAPIWSDVRTFDGTAWRGKVDCIIGGFPCPPVSVAGNRKGAEDERWLWGEFARIIAEVQPLYIFIENVPGLLSGDGQRSTCLCGWSDRWGRLYNDQPSATAGEVPPNEYFHFSRDGNESDNGAKRAELGVEWRGSAEPIKERPTFFNGSLETAWAGSGLRLETATALHAPKASAGGDCHSATGRRLGGEGDSANSRQLEMDGGSYSEVDEGKGTNNDPKREGPTTGRSERTCRACGEQMGEEDSQSLRGAMGDVLWSLADLGYDSEWCRLSAARCGASHKRERVFILGYAKSEHAAPVENSARLGRPGLDGESWGSRRRGVCEAGEPVGDAANDNRWSGERREKTGVGPRGFRGIGSTSPSSDVGNTEELGMEGLRPGGLSESPAPAGPRLSGRASGIFPPGPTAFDEWNDVLGRYPWLAPAIAEEEVKPDFRFMANGLASLVVQQRTDALRMLGNGVVPLQACCSFISLARRCGIMSS
jgi:site-specific DNA-cytosine methylase